MQRPNPDSYLAGGGETAEIIRTRNWTNTPFGQRDLWPAHVRVALSLCLTSRFPMNVLWGPRHLMLYNDAYAAILQDKHPDALGRPALEVWHEIRHVLGPFYERVLERNEPASSERVPLRVNRRGRFEEAYFTFSYSPLRNERGEADGIFTVVTENTAELVSSRTFLDSLIENLPNMVFVKDAKDLRFVRFNKAGEDLLGLPREALLGKNDADFFPPEEASHFIRMDREVLKGREIVDIPEEPITTHHRGVRILHTRKIPWLSSDGTPEYLLGISDDITEKKKAEEERLRISRQEAALAEREAANRRVSLIAEASTLLASSLNYRETLYRLAHLAVPTLADWCTVTTLREDGEFERVAAVHWDPEKQPLLDELSARYAPHARDETSTGTVVLTGKSRFLASVDDEQLVRAARDERHLELMRALGCNSCIMLPLPGRERVHGVITLVRAAASPLYTLDDLAIAEEIGRRAGVAIENARLYDAAQKAVQARDTFLSIASHELKTPLTSLSLQTQIRQRNLARHQAGYFSPEQLAKMLHHDERQLHRLTRLIDDMLDISRINSGKLTMQPEPVNLSALVKEVADRLGEEFTQAGCTFTFREEAPAEGHWDRFRIEQVITNLLTNALKYGPGKPVEARVSREGGFAVLTVSDQGIGIAKRDQERIFRQFERAVRSNEVSGLGLGLYIVSQILELHGGKIQVESEPGQGAKFTVRLPIA